jgi:hypothetical protein
MVVKIQVSAEKIPDLVSWRIMRFLNFEGSHIFLVIEEDDRMFHAVGAGVCDESYSEFCKTHHICFTKSIEVACTKEQFYEWYEKHKGIPYSDSQYVGFFLSLFKRLVRNHREKAICSEFVAWFMADLAGRKDFADADFLSPKDVFERI